MVEIIVKNQDDFNRIPNDYDGTIKILDGYIIVDRKFKKSVVARNNSSVVARNNSSVEAWNNSSVEAWDKSSVVAWDNSSVVAWGWVQAL